MESASETKQAYREKIESLLKEWEAKIEGLSFSIFRYQGGSPGMTMKQNSDGGTNGFLENRRGINPLGFEARQKGISLEGASEHRNPGPGKRGPQRVRPGVFDQTKEGLERKLSRLIQTAREAGIKVTIRDRAS